MALEMFGNGPCPDTDFDSSKLEDLQEAYLQNSDLSSVGPPGCIASVCPKLHTLDLSGCQLLQCWELVAQIGSELKDLATLHLKLVPHRRSMC